MINFIKNILTGLVGFMVFSGAGIFFAAEAVNEPVESFESLAFKRCQKRSGFWDPFYCSALYSYQGCIVERAKKIAKPGWFSGVPKECDLPIAEIIWLAGINKADLNLQLMPTQEQIEKTMQATSLLNREKSAVKMWAEAYARTLVEAAKAKGEL